MDQSLSRILEALATRAWSKPCHDLTGSFLLCPSLFEPDTSPEALGNTLRRLYEHARNWAPGLDIPYFVPPVRVTDLTSEAGLFRIDEESYATVAVSREFVGSFDAAFLILAHEACHHILFQSALSQRVDIALNEITTDLTMFVCGFGEIVQRGHSMVRRSRSHYMTVHLGYLRANEYRMAHNYVLSRRAAERLPGVSSKVKISSAREHVSNFFAPLTGYVRKVFRRSSSSVQRANRSDELLLRKVLEETERRRNREGS